jgi:hypothetical protein
MLGDPAAALAGTGKMRHIHWASGHPFPNVERAAVRWNKRKGGRFQVTTYVDSGGGSYRRQAIVR